MLHFQTHVVKNEEGATIKERSTEETGLGGSVGGEKAETSAEGCGCAVWYVPHF